MVKTVIQNEKICESNTFDHSSGPCGLVQLCCTPDDFPSVVHEPPYQLVLMMAQTNKIIVRGSLIRPKPSNLVTTVFGRKTFLHKVDELFVCGVKVSES